MHILLIEDDLDLGSALQKALRSDGISSEWYRRRADIPACFIEEGYDCALLDLTLPDGSGIELLRTWRFFAIKLPVLIITARTALQDRLEGLDCGADDFICKPFATAELLSRIRAVVRRAARQASDVWVFDDLQIEPRRHRVRIAGQDPELSLREFQLLVELAREYAQVVPKATLAQRLNPLGDPLEPGAIEVHLSNLRKKIGAHRISTIRGVGYMLSK